MRTTLDLPDELFKQAKLTAVLESDPLKTIIARALERGLNAPAAEPARSRKAATRTKGSAARSPEIEALLAEAERLTPPGPPRHGAHDKKRLPEIIRAHTRAKRAR